jgi:hypothetical protein
MVINLLPSKSDIVKELHKPARKKFKRRRIIIKGLNETLQADLAEMIPYAKENQQFKYILVVIDCFSKYYCGQKKWDIKFLSVLKNSM